MLRPRHPFFSLLAPLAVQTAQITSLHPPPEFLPQRVKTHAQYWADYHLPIPTLGIPLAQSIDTDRWRIPSVTVTVVFGSCSLRNIVLAPSTSKKGCGNKIYPYDVKPPPIAYPLSFPFPPPSHSSNKHTTTTPSQPFFPIHSPNFPGTPSPNPTTTHGSPPQLATNRTSPSLGSAHHV
ncbi:hypothetical protein B0T14DRAFT_498847 [Immersiella caudata]|uniref:Uncharacterized protein n=1 Tax=Immersiella caudata TaxID=314043 RepID=A0AA40BTR3_9PEZI|nr:hypothetical protein B0T14DRAFT_498847 [Immersiella caudata]